jgi:hypothetical protein
VRDLGERQGPHPATYLGKYPGNVLDADAGDRLRGSLLVEVPALLEEDPASSDGARRPLQVWALPCFPPGLYYVPDKGTHVWVEFVGGRVEEALWTGVWYADDDKLPKMCLGRAPGPTDRILHTPDGHELAMVGSKGDDDAEVTVRDIGGGVLRMAEGSVEIRSKDDKSTLTVASGTDGTVTIVVGKATFTVTDDCVEVTAKAIKLNAASAAKPLVRSELLTWLAAHTHPAVGGTTGPPVTSALISSAPLNCAYLADGITAGPAKPIG